MAIKEIKQNNFWSGMGNDIRGTLASGYYYSENMDIKGRTLKQVMNNQAENSLGYSSYFITKIIQTGETMYAIGHNNATQKYTTLFTKTANLSSTWEVIGNGTINLTTYTGGNSLLSNIGGTMYISGGTDWVSRYNTGTGVMTANWKALTGGMYGGTIWQGNVYGWSGNEIFKIDPVANTLTGMILMPAEQTPVDIIPYGNLLMIVCTSNSTNSKAYLWDGATTTTFTEILDLGVGTVVGGDVLDGVIYIVIGTSNKKTIKIKGFNGGFFRTVYTYSARPDRAGTYAYIQPASKPKAYSGYLYFVITGTKPDGTYANYYEYSVVRYGREEAEYPMAFTIYKTIDFTSSRTLNGQTTNNDLVVLENISGTASSDEKSVMVFIYSANNATTQFVSSSATNTAQSGVMETYKIDGGDPSIEKKLKSVSAFYSALSTTGQVIMKYKKDEQTTWTTIFTDTTDNAISYQAVCVEGTWSVLPVFKEIQFRFETTGGVELTGYKAKWEELAQNDYA